MIPMWKREFGTVEKMLGVMDHAELMTVRYIHVHVHCTLTFCMC